MQITLRSFAQLRELRGADEETLSVPAGSTVGALFQQLFGATPAGSLPVAFAVNHALVGSEHALQDGDLVAFLPPVGGG
ncbi:MAG: MoaD/ThiS family protein [Myxococcota bacterium]|nr:MoaD/ThiS family protein [Myxococcota bacterium]